MAKRTQAWSKVKFSNGADQYQVISNNVTNSTIGAGASGDYLDALTLVVSNASVCSVSLRDGAGNAISLLPNSPGGGIGPYTIPLGLAAVNNWNITMNTGVTGIATGLFRDGN